jgi:hypothetical protein
MYRVIVLMFAAVLLSACSTKLNLSEYLPEWAGGQRSTAGWNSTMLANLLHSVVPAFVVLSQDLGPLGACLGITGASRLRIRTQCRRQSVHSVRAAGRLDSASTRTI